MERLQKYIAHCGVCSRRHAEELILSKRVKVNGEIVTELGVKVDELVDKIQVDGISITKEENKIYIALNKPCGYVSTVCDEKDRDTILDLVNVSERIYPIGRLDYDSSGLIILTNDGEIYNKIIHPREQINKTYIADIQGIPSEDEINRFCDGIEIDGNITSKSSFRVIRAYTSSSTVEIIIHEGKNRQIRKMCDVINHPVISLNRISIGDIKLGDLKLGTWRFLSQSEISYLNNL